jgi:hypothetical protein
VCTCEFLLRQEYFDMIVNNNSSFYERMLQEERERDGDSSVQWRGMGGGPNPVARGVSACSVSRWHDPTAAETSGWQRRTVCAAWGREGRAADRSTSGRRHATDVWNWRGSHAAGSGLGP